ncbi:SDR family NAD(P)-dependent oxidoreductase [Ilumatobacter coccineus]|uniref:Putative oxidoreductase n=1 Tax=Ilumatobacter coccineus (strain NBRC 103263 / KCTC 29153 / YM16-304) TaxID=1313172 RepID=A0A6C7E0W4_ILUCY|nr:SDR family NAD(P)-dependent oxidoreductase [Ilumatobacter coccineus]BAN00640.1 putative oxidoreductase [Ilumatobacter coccineus YM16-304]
MTNSTLAGQVALITGGGTGIGLGCARALAADGAAVVLAARNTERLEAAAERLVAELPDAEVATVACDVTDEASVAAACEHAAEMGRFSIVVANAGYGSASPFHLTSTEEWNGVINTNLTGAFITMREAVPHLVAAGGGSIVAVSSIAGVETHRFMTPYTVSKAGLEMLVKQVADELGPSRIRANAVRPGLVPTDATEGMMQVPAIVDDYLAQMPLGRAGLPEEIGAAVRFLAGPESAWVTGTCMSVDGGHHLRRGPNLDAVMDMLHPDGTAPTA